MGIEKMLKDRRHALASLRTEVASIEREIDKLLRRLNDEKIQEVTNEPAAYTGGLILIPIRNTLVGENTASDLEGELDCDVCLIGHGPWDEEEFKDFLEAREFNVMDPDDHFGVLIVGRSIDEHEMVALRSVLDYHIDSDEPLVVVSQELFVLGLIQLINPLEYLSEDELYGLAEGHGGLTTVIEFEGFEWPYFEPDPNTSSSAIYDFDPSALGAESPLHRIGYTVAEGRLTKAQRWTLLAEMFRTTREDVFLGEFELRAWGRPQTQQRLYAMAKHISWLIGFRGGAAPRAADRWREDLVWLKNNYFQHDMKFNWPSVAGSSVTTVSQRANDSTANRASSTTWPFPTGSRP